MTNCLRLPLPPLSSPLQECMVCPGCFSLVDSLDASMAAVQRLLQGLRAVKRPPRRNVLLRQAKEEPKEQAKEHAVTVGRGEEG